MKQGHIWCLFSNNVTSTEHSGFWNWNNLATIPAHNPLWHLLPTALMVCCLMALYPVVGHQGLSSTADTNSWKGVPPPFKTEELPAGDYGVCDIRNGQNWWAADNASQPIKRHRSPPRMSSSEGAAASRWGWSQQWSLPGVPHGLEMALMTKLFRKGCLRRRKERLRNSQIAHVLQTIPFHMYLYQNNMHSYHVSFWTSRTIYTTNTLWKQTEYITTCAISSRVK